MTKKKPKWLQQLTYHSCEHCRREFYFQKELYIHSISSCSNNRGIIRRFFGDDWVMECQEGDFVGQFFPLKELPTMFFANGLTGHVIKKEDAFSIKVYNVNIDIVSGMIISFKDLGYWV